MHPLKFSKNTPMIITVYNIPLALSSFSFIEIVCLKYWFIKNVKNVIIEFKSKNIFLSPSVYNKREPYTFYDHILLRRYAPYYLWNVNYWKKKLFINKIKNLRLYCGKLATRKWSNENLIYDPNKVNQCSSRVKNYNYD